MTKMTVMVMGMALAFAPLAMASQPQDSGTNRAKQDLKDAGHDTKHAAVETGHAVKKGTVKTVDATKTGTEKAAHATFWNGS